MITITAHENDGQPLSQIVSYARSYMLARLVETSIHIYYQLADGTLILTVLAPRWDENGKHLLGFIDEATTVSPMTTIDMVLKT